MLLALATLGASSHPKCTWFKAVDYKGKCIANGTRVCDLYKSVRPRLANDEYTLKYFDQYVCKDICTQSNTMDECYIDHEVNKCGWVGPESNSPGFCRGQSLRNFISDTMEENGETVKREAQFSYAIK